jgi:hypothetical protein
MKRVQLLVVIILMSITAIAQAGFGSSTYFSPSTSYPNNSFKQQLGASLNYVTSASVNGSFNATNANDGGWGGTTPLTNANLVAATVDSLGCSGLTGNTPTVSGNVVLVFRGTCQFSWKAMQAQNAGAIGIIIVNNIPGVAAMSMGAGNYSSTVTIPVVGLSYQDGMALYNALNSGQTITVNYSTWSLGFANDLAILPNSMAASHAQTYPKFLLQNVSTSAYDEVTAALIANIGSVNQSNVVLKNTASFTPTGGSSSVVNVDSAVIPTFNTTDSIFVDATISTFTYNPQTTGKYQFDYSVSSNQTDGNPNNNTASRIVNVTDSILSKCNYDVLQNKMITTANWRYSNSNANMFGSMYQFSHPTLLKRVDFSMYSNSATLAGESVNIYVFRWNDGNVTTDNVIQSGELSLVGAGTKAFGIQDSNGKTFTADISAYGIANPGTLNLDSNAWYWIAIEFSPNLFMGFDQNNNGNGFVRSLSRINLSPGYAEFTAPNYWDSYNALMSNPNNIPSMITFGPPNANDGNYTDQKQYGEPAIGLEVTPGSAYGNQPVITHTTPLTFCLGRSVVLSTTSTIGNTYQWFENNIPISGETNNSYTAFVTGNYSVAVSFNNVSWMSNTVQVSNSGTPPSLSLGATYTNICVSGSTTIYANTQAGSILWNTGSTASNITVSPTQSTYYAVTVTDANGCVATDSLLVNVDTNPTPTMVNIATSGSTVLCSPGASVTLSVGTGNNYLWSNNATAQSITVNTAGNYSVSFTNEIGCPVNSNTVSVVSKVLPNNVKIKALSQTTVCEPHSVVFGIDPNASAVSGFSYQWNLAGSPISGATDSTYSVNAPGGGAITLTVSGSNCSRTSTSKTYTVKPMPVAQFVSLTSTTFCAGGSVFLSAPNINGYTYTWLNNGLSVGGGNAKQFKVAGNYQVVAKLNNCTDTSSAVTVIVNPVPSANITSSGPTAICSGSYCTLNVAASPATGNYTYFVVNGNTAWNWTNPYFEVTLPGTYKAMVEDNNTGCVSKLSASNVKVTALPTPLSSISPAGSVTISSTGSVKLNAAPTAGVSWQWYKDGNVISGATNKSYTASSAGSYTVAITKTGCTGISAATVVTQAGVKEEPGTTNGSEMSFELGAYPNPVSDVLTVNVTGIEEVNGTVTVMDFNGRLVISKEMKASSMTVDMTGMASGVYLVRYKDGEGRTGTIKITKQ